MALQHFDKAYAATTAAYNQNRYNNPDLSTHRYNPSWRNHPNLRYGNQSQAASPSAPPATPSLEDLVKQLVVNSTQYQQRTDASIQKLTTQMGQIANAIGQLQVQGSGNLPVQTVPNPNVSAITLRSGRVVQKNKKKTVEEDKEILDTVRKVAINIPLLDAINIPCSIGDRKFENCMLDLGVGINVMHTSVNNNLDLGPLQPTGLIVQLANRSNARPAGGTHHSSRPFMRTAKPKVDVYDGTMSMEFGDIVVKFNIFYAMKHPLEEHYGFYMDLVYELVDETCSEFFSADFPSLSDFDDTYSCNSCTNTNLCSVCAEIESALQNNNFHTGESEVVNGAVCIVEVLDIPAVPTKPSIEQPPYLELKPLLENLKYAYLEENEMLPVIFSSNLDCEQEEKLL
ncbi:hypothetical protein TSUD_136500 [Trifolium subterraneum]|uniref:Aspartic peptidase DDI1-type domain-containing protein n=1 Tax=Trifolium subterraneum TaxID=3900 RepID=A0A2Z6PH92_TRISU|nr:hypothetical protein TSUD_136500 [Trifolium subterraneum]